MLEKALNQMPADFTPKFHVCKLLLAGLLNGGHNFYSALHLSNSSESSMTLLV